MITSKKTKLGKGGGGGGGGGSTLVPPFMGNTDVHVHGALHTCAHTVHVHLYMYMYMYITLTAGLYM